MADFRPFRALRFDPNVAGDPSTLIAPPYDVVSPQQQAAMHARSLYNISIVDYGETLPGDTDRDNRYTRARDEVARWLAEGVLATDPAPHFYVYDQEFTTGGRHLRRRSIFGRLRLEEWDAGVVLPHENTRAAAKADRLKLLEATRVHLSPIMTMYRGASSGPLIKEDDLGAVVMDAELSGERHLLRTLDERAEGRVGSALAAEKLYIADGHHRYEVALYYRNECRAKAPAWTGEEPENFVLAAIVDINDPGLVVLPTHRLARMPGAFEDLTSRLGAAFDVQDAGDAGNPADIDRLVASMAAAEQPGPAFGAAGLQRGRLGLIRVRDRAAVESQIPQDHAAAWRALDVNVLHHALFPALGALSRPEEIEFTEDAHEATREVMSGRWDIALLLNATPVEQVLACADAGERMPQKSTFFYPKLATGAVMYGLDERA
jgi:uncharacterized protein (DUF1015 family)